MVTSNVHFMRVSFKVWCRAAESQNDLWTFTTNPGFASKRDCKPTSGYSLLACSSFDQDLVAPQNYHLESQKYLKTQRRKALKSRTWRLSVWHEVGWLANKQRGFMSQPGAVEKVGQPAGNDGTGLWMSWADTAIHRTRILAQESREGPVTNFQELSSCTAMQFCSADKSNPHGKTWR